MFQLYLDDVRNPPGDDWLVIRIADAMLEVLRANKEFNKIHLISLDHDLGTTDTGYDILLWLEAKCSQDLTYLPPYVKLHTANVSARIKMVLAAEKINKIRAERIGNAYSS